MNVYITRIRTRADATEIPAELRDQEGIIAEHRKFNPRGIKQALLDSGEVAYLVKGEYRVLSRKAMEVSW